MPLHAGYLIFTVLKKVKTNSWIRIRMRIKIPRNAIDCFSFQVLRILLKNHENYIKLMNFKQRR